MLNIDNYSLQDWLAKLCFDCSQNREPPPRVPLASFGFQKPLANSGGISRCVALRRSEFWRKNKFWNLAVSSEQNPNFFPTKSWCRILKKDSAGRNNFSGVLDSPCLGWFPARRRGLGRNAGGIRFTFLFGIWGGQKKIQIQYCALDIILFLIIQD